ncbi:hypothetical protein SAMN04489723_10312 [Algoriphagus aquimarinus]|uniref:Uncharacterized protein n=1 Tax=Algoriphagus aquimarinus TaxID=237018 RepID=A0A1I0X6J3_9BACT|nr:hypothetical protein SAMN04489723_10312 [Algoriphagus aquimarinus]
MKSNMMIMSNVGMMNNHVRFLPIAIGMSYKNQIIYT